MKQNINVLFVCMGNICRSPAGEAILRHHVSKDPSLKIEIDSCGIGDWHIGKGADLRMQEASSARGIILTGRAKQFKTHFLDQFDYILAADQEILKLLYQVAESPEQKSKIYLMTHFSTLYKDQEVPDPYYLAGGAFELVLDILEDSCQGLIKHIKLSQ